ncbi:hypothetical protein CAPTEDRAFT_200055 [Capitella teleta]|uniref:Uncharacterized protein n=1 Tax=Capitella teleta TaxID=283909 RepID=R7V2P6_CAPTE|nr:hypothetical protein CAPTEDRAFT_200055 [Capitella teleta]|eukprot:ELU12737.1 hypothetical protein CAPTEDRAFT_200055 [Capitella teleta]
MRGGIGVSSRKCLGGECVKTIPLHSIRFAYTDTNLIHSLKNQQFDSKLANQLQLQMHSQFGSATQKRTMADSLTRPAEKWNMLTKQVLQQMQGGEDDVISANKASNEIDMDTFINQLHFLTAEQDRDQATLDY